MVKCKIKIKNVKIKFTNVIICSLIIMMMFTWGRDRSLKNIFLVTTIFCLTVLSAILMMTTDDDTKGSKDIKQEKIEQAAKKKEKTQKNQKKELEIKTQEDLAKIIYSKQDEQTKMNAYNEAVKKGILPRSNNYQESVYAYEESVWLKNN